MKTIEQTTVAGVAPEQVVRTTKVVNPAEPVVVEKHPQAVYEQKKTLVRSYQVIWYILGVIEVLLAFRLFLKMLGASPFTGFTNFIYAITLPMVLPFQGIIGTIGNSNYVFEWASVIAGFVYACVAWGLVYLLNILYPITPQDIEDID